MATPDPPSLSSSSASGESASFFPNADVTPYSTSESWSPAPEMPKRERSSKRGCGHLTAV